MDAIIGELLSLHMPKSTCRTRGHFTHVPYIEYTQNEQKSS